MTKKEIDEIYRKIKFGVDYYPEHWQEERLETDAELMERLGVEVVRMAEFSWHKMEPEHGKYDFAWLDHAIAVLGRHGIYTILGTPTAAPPAWMIADHPDILPVNADGQKMSFGGRHHDCQSNAVYREYIREFVTAMAEHFKDNAYVIGWQIDNELGNSHENLCYCDNCRKAFQNWLQTKYRTIDRVNAAWGTGFWSQDYDSFAQIPVPKMTPNAHNPSLLLDFKRFCSDLVTDFQNFQIEMIRKIAPHQRITHNFMGFYDKTDYYELADRLDFVSSDQYPTGYYFETHRQPPEEVAACMDLTRSFQRQNFWMMEMQSGATGGAIIGETPRPGQLRLWTAQSIAHGADTVVYFRWRTCLFGTEQFWHGILPHNGVPGRRYEEIKDTIRDLLPVMQDTYAITPKAKIAILFSYDEDWALKNQPQNPGLSYQGILMKYYRSLYTFGQPVDFISEKDVKSDVLKEYTLVIAPLLYLMDEETENRLETYVADGGKLLLTMRTGVMDRNNKCMSEYALPGRLGRIVGAEVEEYDSLYGKTVPLVYENEKVGEAANWCDILNPSTAKTLMKYDGEYYKDRAAVTVNAYEKGTVWYVGTNPEQKTQNLLIQAILTECGMQNVCEQEVEKVVREGRKRDYLFLLNHREETVKTDIPEGWDSVEEAELKPYEVRILVRKK